MHLLVLDDFIQPYKEWGSSDFSQSTLVQWSSGVKSTKRIQVRFPMITRTLFLYQRSLCFQDGIEYLNIIVFWLKIERISLNVKKYVFCVLISQCFVILKI